MTSWEQFKEEKGYDFRYNLGTMPSVHRLVDEIYPEYIEWLINKDRRV